MAREAPGEDATLMDWATVFVAAVIFLATLIRSSFGFGEALVAVPLLALLIPVKVAVPLAVLFSITVAAVVVVAGYYGGVGLWVAEVTLYFLLSLALALAAIFLGRAVNRRLKGRSFLLYIHAGLIAIGGWLLVQTLRG